LDVTIVSDNFSLEDACKRKIEYYRKDDIIRWIKLETGVLTVKFGVVVASWRGCVAESTGHKEAEVTEVKPSQNLPLHSKTALKPNKIYNN